MNKNAYLLAMSLLLPSTFVLADQDCCPPNCEVGVRNSWVSASHREGNGIGVNQGYTSLEFFHLHRCDFFGINPFIDLRGHVFNDGRTAANAGIGSRSFCDESNMVFGWNVFYDFRQASHHSHFHQVGAGVEALGVRWDARLNGYFPFAHTKHEYKEGFFEFKDHQAIFAKRSVTALTGGDLELGRYLWKCDLFDLHGTVGGYYFERHGHERLGGGLLRLDLRLGDYFSLNGQTSYDNHFNWRGSGEVTFTVPIGRRVTLCSDCLCCDDLFTLEQRLVEPLTRFEMIVVAKHKKKSPAIDPITGDPLFFVFVDNERGHSDGSFENPYPTLLEAQDNSKPGDVIYVFAGDGTTTGMDQGIFLQDNQQFLGSGVNHFFLTQFDWLKLPKQTALLPSIDNENMTFTIGVNNNNTIRGFNILNSTGTAGIVNFSLKNDLEIKRNAFFSDANIFLQDFGGTIDIKKNTFVESGIHVDHGVAPTYNTTIAFNSPDDIANSSVSIDVSSGNGLGTVTILENICNNAIEVSKLETGQMIVYIKDNLSINNDAFNSNANYYLHTSGSSAPNILEAELSGNIGETGNFELDISNTDFDTMKVRLFNNESFNGYNFDDNGGNTDRAPFFSIESGDGTYLGVGVPLNNLTTNPMPTDEVTFDGSLVPPTENNFVFPQFNGEVFP